MYTKEELQKRVDAGEFSDDIFVTEMYGEPVLAKIIYGSEYQVDEDEQLICPFCGDTTVNSDIMMCTSCREHI